MLTARFVSSNIIRRDEILRRLFSAIMFGLLFAGMLFSASAIELGKSARTWPEAYMITVPWHQQLNALSCGAASLESVFDYWGPDIDQKEIMNTARTSSMGTWSADIVRTGHFSYLSDAQGNYFPHAGPYRGFEERPLGYAAFSYASHEFWLDKLKKLIAENIPVIVLMKYSPEGGGGHYRVAIGYDDIQQQIYFIDPWGRDLNHLTDWTGITSWSYSDFQKGWNYSEYGATEPFFGVAIIPWTISLNIKGKTAPGAILTMTAQITYPCPEPFDNAQFPARDAVAQITLSQGMMLKDSSATVPLGTIYAGSTVEASWKVICSSEATGKTVSIESWGIVSGHVPQAQWQGQVVSYPAYEYTDAIGSEATINTP